MEGKKANIYRNNKTKALYDVVNDDVIDCTNERYSISKPYRMVHYKHIGTEQNSEVTFAREYEEFNNKFTKA